MIRCKGLRCTEKVYLPDTIDMGPGKVVPRGVYGQIELAPRIEINRAGLLNTVLQTSAYSPATTGPTKGLTMAEAVTTLNDEVARANTSLSAAVHTNEIASQETIDRLAALVTRANSSDAFNSGKLAEIEAAACTHYTDIDVKVAAINDMIAELDKTARNATDRWTTMHDVHKSDIVALRTQTQFFGNLASSIQSELDGHQESIRVMKESHDQIRVNQTAIELLEAIVGSQPSAESVSHAINIVHKLINNTQIDLESKTDRITKALMKRQDESWIKIQGWDVNADPNQKFKTAGVPSPEEVMETLPCTAFVHDESDHSFQGYAGIGQTELTRQVPSNTTTLYIKTRELTAYLFRISDKLLSRQDVDTKMLLSSIKDVRSALMKLAEFVGPREQKEPILSIQDLLKLIQTDIANVAKQVIAVESVTGPAIQEIAKLRVGVEKNNDTALQSRKSFIHSH